MFPYDNVCRLTLDASKLERTYQYVNAPSRSAHLCITLQLDKQKHIIDNNPSKPKKNHKLSQADACKIQVNKTQEKC